MIKFPENTSQPKEDDIYMMLQLVINPSETDCDKAVIWEPIGYVNTAAEAVSSMTEGGITIGNGWPLKDGTKYSNRAFIRLPKI